MNINNKVLFGSIAGVFLVFVISYLIDPYLPSQISRSKQGFQSAKNLVAKSPIGSLFVEQTDVRSFIGKVTSVGNNVLTVKDQTTARDIFDTSNTANKNLEYTVQVTPTTSITKVTSKDSKTFQAENDAYVKAYKSATTDPARKAIERPTPYKTTTLSYSSIKAGDMVVIGSVENIKTTQRITAKEIRVSANPLQ